MNWASKTACPCLHLKMAESPTRKCLLNNKMSPRKYMNWSKYQWDNSFERTQNWTASMSSCHMVLLIFSQPTKIWWIPLIQREQKNTMSFPRQKPQTAQHPTNPQFFWRGFFCWCYWGFRGAPSLTFLFLNHHAALEDCDIPADADPSANPTRSRARGLSPDRWVSRVPKCCWKIRREIHSLKLTAKAPENGPKPKRKRSSSNH